MKNSHLMVPETHVPVHYGLLVTGASLDGLLPGFPSAKPAEPEALTGAEVQFKLHHLC